MEVFVWSNLKAIVMYTYIKQLHIGKSIVFEKVKKIFTMWFHHRQYVFIKNEGFRHID